MAAPAYAIGSHHLPGLSKLIEEAGEVSQVAGKIIGIGHMGDHFDGSNLKARLEEEIADLVAACAFVSEKLGLDHEAMGTRADEKRALFERWHDEYQ